MNPVDFPNYELLSPDSTLVDPHNWTITGGSTIHGVLADESDSTFIYINNGDSTTKVGFSDPRADRGRSVKAVDFQASTGGGRQLANPTELVPSSIPAIALSFGGDIGSGLHQGTLLSADGLALLASDLNAMTLQWTTANNTYFVPQYQMNKVRARIWYAAKSLVLWRPITIAGSNSFRSIAYGNDVLVASRSASSSSTSNSFATSADGITWTSRSGGSNNKQYQSLAFGNGVFVAIQNAGGTATLYSADGINWSGATGIDKVITSVCFGNGVFVAIANTGTQNARAFTSTDGQTWTPRTTPNDTYALWNVIAYANGKFCAVGQQSDGIQKVMTSTDGISWTLTDISSTTGPYLLLATDGSRFVGSNGPDAYYSTNGTSWTRVINAFPGLGLGSIMHDGTSFVCVGTSAIPRILAYRSSDGVTWTAATDQLMISGGAYGYTGNGAMTYLNGRYLIAGGSQIYASQELT